MIFDWYDNSVDILKNNCLKNTDKRDHKSFYLQEIYFLRYLIALGKNKEECLIFWSNIKNGSANIFNFDHEQKDIIFHNQYKKAMNMGPLLDTKCRCNIYKSEIDFINNLQAPLWVREYWAGIMVWYKCMKFKYKYPEKDLKWFSWILGRCENNYQYKRKSDVISEWNRKCKKPIESYVFNNLVYIKIDWIVDNSGPEDKLVCENLVLENFTSLFKYLIKESFICSECGDRYEANEKTKRNICEKCYLKKRYCLQYLYHKSS